MVLSDCNCIAFILCALQDGLDIKGMEGTLVEVIEKYQGKQLSANLPYKTQFMIPKDEGKDMKLIVHLVSP